MLNLKSFRGFQWLLLLPVMMWTGCVTSTITNLTPSALPRNPDGFYPVEMALSSNQQTLRHDTIKPYVVVGFDFYPMQRTLNMNNRWETLIPVPTGQTIVHYRFKLDYEYAQFGRRGQGSKMSTEYKLTVKD